MAEPPTSYCPNCLAEYRPGFDTCADCGVKLVRGPAAVTEEHAPDNTKYHAHPTEDRHQVPVVLATLPRLEAQILAGKLQAEGLVASADEPALMSAYGGALPESRMIRVWVLESQLDEAREIARRALSGDDAI
jgi:Putative prokaryotic signal transducing protein